MVLWCSGDLESLRCHGSVPRGQRLLFGGILWLPPDTVLLVGPYWATSTEAGWGAGGPTQRPTFGGLSALGLPQMLIGGPHLYLFFWVDTISRLSRAAACRARTSCGAGEVPLAQGLDRAGARIGVVWVAFGGAEGVIAWQFYNVAWALSGGLDCSPGEEG
ncbi:hypothetical protein NDU88_006163 [Pleurodeles waltl]|uniref:Uncharacterized protein n=1 Tax=Pleurodeles waltl TaxID=8319 RepID=A0AAV7MF03_PLEWA|nr:hypothetical protein NDU88_006163 [Pleurodeles waltl]